MVEVVADLATFRQGSSNVTGGLWLKAGDRQFPSAGWNDFPVVVLGWWLDGLGKLAKGAPVADLNFMDGAYTVRVGRRDKGELSVDLLDGYGSDAAQVRASLTTDFSTLSGAVLQAAEHVENWCRSNGNGGRDERTLRTSADRLRDQI